MAFFLYRPSPTAVGSLVSTAHHVLARNHGAMCSYSMVSEQQASFMDICVSFHVSFFCDISSQHTEFYLERRFNKWSVSFTDPHDA